MDQPASVAGVAGPRFTLPAWGVQALSAQGVLLVSAALLLPAAAHLTGLPVRILLPMHWPVLLVGLCYGWRSGAVVGLTAPCLSFLLSGMPLQVVLPAMTVELAAYGFLAGYSRGHLRWSAFLSTACAIAGGRVLFVTIALWTGATGASLPIYLKAAVLPGLAAGVGQVLLLPMVASWWVRLSR